MKPFTCPRCGEVTPSYRFNCIHCGADVNPRPVFDPDQPRQPLDRWELWLAAWMIIFCATLLALIKMVWPWAGN